MERGSHCLWGYVGVEAQSLNYSCYREMVMMTRAYPQRRPAHRTFSWVCVCSPWSFIKLACGNFECPRIHSTPIQLPSTRKWLVLLLLPLDISLCLSSLHVPSSLFYLCSLFQSSFSLLRTKLPRSPVGISHAILFTADTNAASPASLSHATL